MSADGTPAPKPIAVTPVISRRRTPRGTVVLWQDGLATLHRGDVDESLGVFPVFVQLALDPDRVKAVPYVLAEKKRNTRNQKRGKNRSK